jgi:hypothetical protein
VSSETTEARLLYGESDIMYELVGRYGMLGREYGSSGMGEGGMVIFGIGEQFIGERVLAERCRNALGSCALCGLQQG